MLTVPALVTYKGGDALNICLNTVAILVMCEIDNVAFVIALGENVRSRVKEAGRADLSDVEARALMWTKVVHVLLLVLPVTVAVSFQRPWLTVLVAFLLGGLVASFVQRASDRDGQARREGARGVANGYLRDYSAVPHSLLAPLSGTQIFSQRLTGHSKRYEYNGMHMCQHCSTIFVARHCHRRHAATRYSCSYCRTHASQWSHSRAKVEW